MPTTGLTRIERSIDIQAPPARVFHALTTAKEVAEWFRMTIEGELVVGRDVWMTSAPQHGSMRFPVRIVEHTPPRRVVWQWHPGAVDPKIDYAQEPMTTVTFTIEPTSRGSRLTVSETGFDLLSLERRAKAHADNTQGWTEVVEWIRTYVETKN